MVGGETPGQGQEAGVPRKPCSVDLIIGYREGNRKPLRVSSKVVTSSDLHWKRTPFFSLQIACRGSSCTRPHSPHTGKGWGSQTLHGSVRLPQDQQPVPGAHLLRRHGHSAPWSGPWQGCQLSIRAAH